MSVPDSTFLAVVRRLRAAGCVAAAEEAAEFVAAAPDAQTLEVWLRRREHGEPVAWITGTTRFCGQTLHIAPGVYVPRTQSEELARRAATLLPDAGRAVDLCTGAGAVAAHLAAEVSTATIIGIDVDPIAAACARRNAVPAMVADLAEALYGHEQFDLVTSDLGVAGSPGESAGAAHRLGRPGRVALVGRKSPGLPHAVA